MVEVRTYTEMLMFAEQNPRECAVGETIFEDGSPATEMYIVREGSVELRKGATVLETLRAGEVFGEMALIDPAPRSATAVAGEGCKLVVIDEKTFNQLVQKVPGFALELMRTIVRRLRRAKA